MSGFPALAQDKTVDDVPAVAPESAKEALKKFVETYRTTLSKLDIKAAPMTQPAPKPLMDQGRGRS